MTFWKSLILKGILRILICIVFIKTHKNINKIKGSNIKLKYDHRKYLINKIIE